MPPKGGVAGAIGGHTHHQIAGAGVLGNDRGRTSRAREPAATDPGPPNGPCTPADHSRHSPGTAEAAAHRGALRGPARRPVALGMQSRVVAAALRTLCEPPSYLGNAVHAYRGAGTRSKPDLGAIAGHPDLIWARQADAQAVSPAGGDAPTVFTAAPRARPGRHLRVSASPRAGGAADGLIDGFVQRANQIGASHDAAHFQASIVQLTTDTAASTDSEFPGQRADRGR